MKRIDAAGNMPGLLLTILAAFAVFAISADLSVILRDGDTGWHLAAGRWIVAHGYVPATDPLSYTARGRPWIAHEWLAEVLMDRAYRLGEWRGVLMLFGAALAALFAILAAHLVRWLRAPGAALALAVVAVALVPTLLARPHMLAAPLLAAWIVALMAAREAERAPHPGWLAVMLVWANLHGSFVLGLALAAALGVEAVATARRADRLRAARGWALFAAAAVAVAAINPYGLEGLIHPFRLMGMASLATIAEWKPAYFGRVNALEIVLLVALFFLLARPIAVPVIRLLVLIALLHQSLAHMRQLMVLAIVGAALLAEPLGRGWARGEARPLASLGRTIRREGRGLWPVAAVAALLVAATGGWWLARPTARPASQGWPAAALRTLPPALRARPVFNEYSFGGALAFAGIAPFIDGRNDMYGDAFMDDYLRIARGDVARWRWAQRRWRIGWAIVVPGSGIARVLAREPGWHRVFVDADAVVYAADRWPVTPAAATGT